MTQPASKSAALLGRQVGNIGPRRARHEPEDAVSKAADMLFAPAADPNVVPLLDLSSGTPVTLLSRGGYSCQETKS